MWIDFLTSFPFIALLSLAIAFFIYWIGGRMAESSSQDSEKKILYASGEEPPHVSPHINIERFVIYAVYFYIFDILAFIMVTSFEHTGGATILYAFTVLTALLFLVPHSWRRKTYD
jgi:NADH:ubiquinone oxidoreductase subunit 3 (subunit A)